MNAPAVSLTPGFASLAANYDVILSDVWGVVHNGVAAWPDACDALTRFREQGGAVVLISNAPRPGAGVIKQLERLKVPRNCFDAIVTSGDVTQAAIRQRPGEPIYHIGPERDLSIFTELGSPLVTLEEAAYVVCSGLFSDSETPNDYRPLLNRMRERNLFMICANPDVVVEQGDVLLYCAGALADVYRDLGGEVLYAGKPYRPIYDMALAAAPRTNTTPLDRVLAIGDSVRTDLRGARDLGIDCLFITSGIHAEELGERDNPDMATLTRIFDAAGLRPRAVMRRLVW
jgi:HAD superfamily hydrolase (TIGR01459 family)